MVALHDCNEDVNRAINFLLESTCDTVSLFRPPHCVILQNRDSACLFLRPTNNSRLIKVLLYCKGTNELFKYLYQNSWETVGKKRSLGKEGLSEIKESREKKGGEREVSRGRGGANKRGRGISRGREGKLVSVYPASINCGDVCSSLVFLLTLFSVYHF